jgi:methyl-accepting chemotaxis protein
MRKILTSMRLVREGEYSHKIQMRGSDELATLATEFNKLTDKLQESEAAQRQFVSDARTSSRRRWRPSSCSPTPSCKTRWTRTRCGNSSRTSATRPTA